MLKSCSVFTSEAIVEGDWGFIIRGQQTDLAQMPIYILELSAILSIFTQMVSQNLQLK